MTRRSSPFIVACALGGPIVALGLPQAAFAQATAAPAAPPPAGVDCRPVAADAERLACYDRAIDAARSAAAGTAPVVPAQAAVVRPAPAPTPATTPATATAAAPAEPRRKGNSLTDRWELDPGDRGGTFAISAYKPVYALPAVVADGVNRTPRSANPLNTVNGQLTMDRTEAKFQLSFKTKLAQGLFGDNGDIWGGYTQSSRWQVYNADLSRPFRETNYEPEVMLVLRTDYSALGWNGRLLGLGVNHQSNGRSQPFSRSWNRVIAMWGIERGDWSLVVRPWWRLQETAAVDDNPGIENYIGRADLLLTRAWGAHLVSLQLRHSLRSGDRSRGSAELDWAFPIAGNLRGHVQLFSGYGESLIDYNFRQSRLGIGVSLIEWR